MERIVPVKYFKQRAIKLIEKEGFTNPAAEEIYDTELTLEEYLAP